MHLRRKNGQEFAALKMLGLPAILKFRISILYYIVIKCSMGIVERIESSQNLLIKVFQVAVLFQYIFIYLS